MLEGGAFERGALKSGEDVGLYAGSAGFLALIRRQWR